MEREKQQFVKTNEKNFSNSLIFERNDNKMKKEQNILTLFIILAIIALLVIIGSIVYEYKIEKNKETIESISIPRVETKKEDIVENENQEQEQVKEPEPKKEEYVGEEEQETEKEEVVTTQSKDEKVIELAKKEWGEDNTVTFNIEEKKGTKYYVAVKRDAIVVAWYEVDTENWKINEY